LWRPTPTSTSSKDAIVRPSVTAPVSKPLPLPRGHALQAQQRGMGAVFGLGRLTPGLSPFLSVSLHPSPPAPPATTERRPPLPSSLPPITTDRRRDRRDWAEVRHCEARKHWRGARRPKDRLAPASEIDRQPHSDSGSDRSPAGDRLQVFKGHAFRSLLALPLALL